jgi:glycosyltransferase involved in cell wall biosynthesis
VLITDSLGDRRTGFSIRQHQIVRSLIPLGDLTVISLSQPSESARAWVSSEAGTEIIELSTALLKPLPALRRWLKDPALPWRLAQKSTDTASRELERQLAVIEPDALWVTSPTGWLALPPRWRARSVFDFGDQPTVMHREITRVILRRWLRRIRMFRRPCQVDQEHLHHPVPGDDPQTFLKEIDSMLRWRILESRIARQALAATSSNEEESLPFANRTSSYFVTPNGFDDFEFDDPNWAGDPFIVFPASFTHPPNLDGAEWFVERVLPLIRARNEGIRVILAGSGQPALKQYESMASVIVTGRLDSMDQVLCDGGIVISPLLGGSGTRLKILEAWARGLPVVSTPKGAEGLNATHGVDCLLASTPAEFAEECLRLAESRSRRESIGRSGRTHFREQFGWDTLGLHLRQELTERLGRPAR